MKIKNLGFTREDQLELELARERSKSMFYEIRYFYAKIIIVVLGLILLGDLLI